MASAAFWLGVCAEKRECAAVVELFHRGERARLLVAFRAALRHASTVRVLVAALAGLCESCEPRLIFCEFFGVRMGVALLAAKLAVRAFERERERIMLVLRAVRDAGSRECQQAGHRLRRADVLDVAVPASVRVRFRKRAMEAAALRDLGSDGTVAIEASGEGA